MNSLFKEMEAYAVNPREKLFIMEKLDWNCTFCTAGAIHRTKPILMRTLAFQLLQLWKIRPQKNNTYINYSQHMPCH